jgi:hypothetical protein
MNSAAFTAVARAFREANAKSDLYDLDAIDALIKGIEDAEGKDTDSPGKKAARDVAKKKDQAQAEAEPTKAAKKDSPEAEEQPDSFESASEKAKARMKEASAAE